MGATSILSQTCLFPLLVNFYIIKIRAGSLLVHDTHNISNIDFSFIEDSYK
jgi:hypothetical protein